jgi:hypothetical protein
MSQAGGMDAAGRAAAGIAARVFATTTGTPRKCLKKMVAAGGFEPPTKGL